MKSIVCGAGVVGQSIAESLSKEDLEVTVIDESSEAIKKVSSTLDVKTIVGAASSPSILESAGARDCDIIIAVTKSDETNMIACQIGYSLFKIPTKIAKSSMIIFSSFSCNIDFFHRRNILHVMLILLYGVSVSQLFEFP